jgi:hypothetical protein
MATMNAPNERKPQVDTQAPSVELPEWGRQRRLRRREGIRTAFFGMFMGAVVLGVGVWEFRTGQVFTHIGGGHRLSAPEKCALGAVVLVGSVWALWRILTKRQ